MRTLKLDGRQVVLINTWCIGSGAWQAVEPVSNAPGPTELEGSQYDIPRDDTFSGMGCPTRGHLPDDCNYE